MPFALRDRIGHHQAVIVEDSHVVVLDPEDEYLANQGVGNDEAVAFKADGAVFVDLSGHPPGSVERPSRQMRQVGLFPLEPDLDDLVGRAVNPKLFFSQPGLYVLIGRIAADISITAPEAFPDKRIRTLDLSLDPGGIGRGNLGRKSVMEGKADKGVIEPGLPRQMADIHVLHPVVEDLLRNAAEVLERVDVAAQEGRQVASFDEFGIDLSGIAQDHGKQVQSLDVPVGMLDLELTKVHLSLISRFGFEAHVGHPASFRLEPVHKALDNLITALESHLSKTVVNPCCGMIHVLIEPGLDVVHEPIQLTRAFPAVILCLRKRRILDVFFDGVPADPKPRCNPPLADAVAVQTQNVQNGLLRLEFGPPLESFFGSWANQI